MRAIFLAFLIVWALAFGSASGLSAQGLGGLIAGSGSGSAADAPAPAPSIEEILDRAAAKGVGVVVIDSEGNVISQPADPEAAPAPASATEGTALMALQDRGVRFRAALLERLLELPAATNEVLYILRAASPDGTLWAFGKVLGLSLLLFAVGNLVERQIYGKRLMRGTVTRRIREAPEGYLEKMPFLVFRFAGGVGGILVSMAVAYLLGTLIFGTLQDTAMQFTVTLINIGYFACRFVAVLWRMILSPFLSQYRIPALSDRDALHLHRWLWVLASFDICALLFEIWIAELGLNDDIYTLVAIVLSGAVVLFNLLLIAVQPFEKHLPRDDMAMAPFVPPADLSSYKSRNPNFQFICEVDQRNGFDRATKVTASGRLTNSKDQKDFFDDACFFQDFLPEDLDDTTRMPYDS